MPYLKNRFFKTGMLPILVIITGCATPEKAQRWTSPSGDLEWVLRTDDGREETLVSGNWAARVVDQDGQHLGEAIVPQTGTYEGGVLRLEVFKTIPGKVGKVLLGDLAPSPDWKGRLASGEDVREPEFGEISFWASLNDGKVEVTALTAAGKLPDSSNVVVRMTPRVNAEAKKRAEAEAAAEEAAAAALSREREKENAEAAVAFEKKQSSKPCKDALYFFKSNVQLANIEFLAGRRPTRLHICSFCAEHRKCVRACSMSKCATVELGQVFAMVQPQCDDYWPQCRAVFGD